MIKLKCAPSKLPKPPYKPAMKFGHEKPDTPYESSINIYAMNGSPRNKFYTPEIDDQIMQMREEGHTAEEIAKHFGRTKGAIESRIMRLRGARGRCGSGFYWTPAQDAVIRELRAQGKSFPEIADQMGKSKEAVRKRARHIGLEE